MPLLDHFRPPVYPRHSWESFHANWATRIADFLNDRWLPPEFLAEEYNRTEGRLEIDVATYEEMPPIGRPASNGPAAATTIPVWAPPAAARSVPIVFPRSTSVRVTAAESGGSQLIAAIELISPANKDRPAERQAFAIKCADHLHQGVSVAIIDIVTTRRANLHQEILRLLKVPANGDLPKGATLYAVSYRPVRRRKRNQVDIWPAACSLGQPLPTMPLHLTRDHFVPVEFEASYQEACRRRRLA